MGTNVLEYMKGLDESGIYLDLVLYFLYLPPRSGGPTWSLLNRNYVPVFMVRVNLCSIELLNESDH